MKQHQVVPQLHVSPAVSRLSKARFPSPLRDMNGVKRVEEQSRKPLSHLWTSDYVDGSSAWIDHLNAHRDVIPERRMPDRGWWHLLTPDPKARVIVVDSVAAYDALAREAGRSPDQSLPTRWLAERCDALRIEDGAIAGLRARGIDYDVPCMAWFRWKFARVECVRERLVNLNDVKKVAALLGIAVAGLVA